MLACSCLERILTTRKTCAEDMGKENCFEIITSTRVFFVVAASHKDMVSWMDTLRPFSQLQAENSLITELEDNIERSAVHHSLDFDAHWRMVFKDMTEGNLN
eukprot:TRINITY_DN2036_c0_g1_i1.p1 TRINITY_DN2036_c0_g1~~TRINITY_DN2036_c0_g1_i1.p1  ORF type:complete len:102 (+),score=6.59 TRINITY_DN2036_c0_g1_i1:487-792(+)